MLKIENLSVNYGHVIALEEVSLEVKEGEIITLVGNNGAGKSTLLMAISGMVRKKSGTVHFKGVDITDTEAHKIVKMGVAHVPEGRKIFPQLSVRENLITGTMGNPSLTSERVAELEEEVFMLFPRLKERLKQAGGTLSGGEQQMLALARGLMMDPSILMFDEPSLGLAPIVVEEIFRTIQHIHEQGKTILLIEQNAAMALKIADRGYVLETGKITMEGAGRELISDPEVKRAYLGA